MLAVILLVSSFTALAAEFPALRQGDSGKKVTALRQRLYDLGYLPSFKSEDEAYTKAVAEAVQAFETASGLPATGDASEQVQQQLFSKGAVAALPPFAPKHDVTHTTGPSQQVALPERDAEGFLPSGTAPFVHADRADGKWLYLSDSLQVDISRYHQKSGNIEWFEAFVKTRGNEKPYSVLAKRDGAVFQTPHELMKQNGSVFGITDDFFGYRVRYHKAPGVIVRNGQPLSNKTRIQKRSNLQPLEVLALFQDGTLRTFNSDVHTGEEYLAMGATDTWAFGPVLVQAGRIPRYFYAEDYHSYREPRCAFGMLENGSYAALVVTGRKDNSRGAYFRWMAEKMLAMGCTEAMNLDGGNTVALMFMGDMLNKVKGAKESVRKVSGIIAFGHGAK